MTQSFSRQKVDYVLARYVEVAATPEHICGRLSLSERNIIGPLLLQDMMASFGPIVVLDWVRHAIRTPVHSAPPASGLEGAAGSPPASGPTLSGVAYRSDFPDLGMVEEDE